MYFLIDEQLQIWWEICKEISKHPDCIVFNFRKIFLITGKFFGKDETGAGFRAVLLSGPPGIGKTTTATIVCKVQLNLYSVTTCLIWPYFSVPLECHVRQVRLYDEDFLFISTYEPTWLKSHLSLASLTCCGVGDLMKPHYLSHANNPISMFPWKVTRHTAERFEDIKEVIKSRISKNRQCNLAKRKRTKRQTMIYKTLHRKLKNESHRHHWKLGVNLGAPEGSAVSAPLLTPVMFLLNETGLTLFVCCRKLVFPLLNWMPLTQDLRRTYSLLWPSH